MTSEKASDKKVMTIRKTKEFKENAAPEILGLFSQGVDIVIIEYPKGAPESEGGSGRNERCNVFIRGSKWSPFDEKLWHFTNWIRVTPIDRRFKFCLYSMRDYAHTVSDIKTCFPDIEFQEEPMPIQSTE